MFESVDKVLKDLEEGARELSESEPRLWPAG